MIVRRELSDNYCFYNPTGYDKLNGLYPQFNNKCWAQETLQVHAKDRREYISTKEQFAAGK